MPNSPLGSILAKFLPRLRNDNLNFICLGIVYGIELGMWLRMPWLVMASRGFAVDTWSLPRAFMSIAHSYVWRGREKPSYPNYITLKQKNFMSTT